MSRDPIHENTTVTASPSRYSQTAPVEAAHDPCEPPSTSMSVLGPAPSPALPSFGRTAQRDYSLPPLHHAFHESHRTYAPPVYEPSTLKRKASDTESSLSPVLSRRTSTHSTHLLAPSPPPLSTHHAARGSASYPPADVLRTERRSVSHFMPQHSSRVTSPSRLITSPRLAQLAIEKKHHNNTGGLTRQQQLSRGASHPPIVRAESSNSSADASSKMASGTGSPLSQPNTGDWAASPPVQVQASDRSGLIKADPTPLKRASVGSSGAAPSPVGSTNTTPGLAITTTGEHIGYPVMTYQTSAGVMTVPVETQAASRQADEKRKRNAGASARFRQRRKEREVESTDRIKKLEKQVRGVTEERDYYKRERDYLVSALMQHPEGRRHFPRPLSPRHHTRPDSDAAGGSFGESEYDFVHEAPDSREDVRNVRRRVTGPVAIAAASSTPLALHAHPMESAPPLPAAQLPHHNYSRPGPSYPGLPARLEQLPVQAPPAAAPRIQQLPPLSSFPFPAADTTSPAAPRDPFSSQRHERPYQHYRNEAAPPSYPYNQHQTRPPHGQ